MSQVKSCDCETCKLKVDLYERDKTNVRKPIRVTSCRFQIVASTLSLPSCRSHVVALKIKRAGGGGVGEDCVVGLSLRTLLGFEEVLSQFCIFVFSFLSPPPPPLFQVVASKLSLPRCRFHVVACG